MQRGFPSSNEYRCNGPSFMPSGPGVNSTALMHHVGQAVALVGDATWVVTQIYLPAGRF